MREPLRIGNVSGFYGDRYSAMQEMLEGGDVDVITGDYLAELTMLILGRDRLKAPQLGYAKTFLRQVRDCLSLALERNVTIVANAGGLNPSGLAQALRALSDELGLHPRIGYVTGDDLLPRAEELQLGTPLTANAYLGAWGIAECLKNKADIVVTGRVTDASLVVGPAAAHYGWGRTDYDALAGAVVAGHVIECGTQATGGNYSFFTEIADLQHPGFPIAEVFADGSSIITKHPGTGGAVSVGTVTAQLLYEIAGARYAGPDVTARFDTLDLRQLGEDRVRISGAKGEPPPPTLKVGRNVIGGFRNEVTFVLTGLQIEEKARLLREQLEKVIPADASWTLARTDQADADTEETASAQLRCVVRSSDPKAIGRRFANAGIELALASYPGFHVTAPPADASIYGVFDPAYVDAHVVSQVAQLDLGDGGEPTPYPIAPAGETLPLAGVDEPPLPAPLPSGATRREPLGTVVGARSGDKGGSANVGVWVRSDPEWRWLAHALTVEKFKELLPEARDLEVTRHVFGSLRALNFVIDGILGDGVASQYRFDPQAKAIGEWLRARVVEIPEVLL
ncbi:uncharacterized protein DUF1446 [Jatrophihabitans sp. GAS493]|uniref:acyclic terpene utilization AtuA family protein n=1 Tax=Jatrophihabitans sp. GAS493 TaxID=1907575 RepID=UPI000BB88832|nr:acyclic terpene utilization AtuA family protein [Jatrophihabitans sp. GAS493]SOD72620.1 uncharacterized protein DUF1446 [Jatrophihabitans sp. GAS493]